MVQTTGAGALMDLVAARNPGTRLPQAADQTLVEVAGRSSGIELVCGVCEIGLCSAILVCVLQAEARYHCPKRSSKVFPAAAICAGACHEAPIPRSLERLKAFIRSTLPSPNRN